MKVNLHELINQPGAGKHVPTLQKAGKWDEWAGMPMKKYSVEIEYRGTDTVYVDARCKDAAEEYYDYEFLEAKECN